MTGKVKCTCGWSWNKSDSSKKDMYICHECGRDNSNNMRNGGWLDSYEDGGTMQEHQENYNDSSVSLPEGFEGEGYNTKGRNYSPAWGGQFQDGGEISIAQTGRRLSPTIMPIGNANLFNNPSDWVIDGKVVSKPKNNTRTLNIVDSRKKMATTNKPLRPNSDLVGGKYSSNHLDKLMQEAKRQKLSKQDMINLSAMGFQETKWDKEDEGNIGHTIGNWKGKDEYQDFINAYKLKMKEADRLGIKDPATRLQIYNGFGKVYPSTEKDYHGFNMKKIYGVPVPKEGIDMKKNPLYGKQVMDIRDNVLAKNPEYLQYIDSIYKAPVPKYMDDPKVNKLHHDPKKHQMGGYVYPVNYVPEAAMGASIQGAVGAGTAYQMQNQQGAPQYEEGGVIKDDLGQWAHPGEITEINSNDITMEGVPYDVLGISDTGDTKLMKPGKNYKFKGKKVTEFPMAQNGIRQEQKGLQNLDNLTNFTNYNTKQPGGWLDTL